MSSIQDNASDISPAPQARGRPILHMHIPKTAGTALRSALGRPGPHQLRVFPHYDERQFTDANPADFDVFSGHYGYKTAMRLGGDIITVLRHPVDRFISVYYFWRQLFEKKVEVGRKTKLARLYSLDEFVCLHDEWLLMEEFFNRMTWQVAHGSTIEHRRELRDQGKTENEILAMALRNLETFAIVGLQSRMDDFTRAIGRRFGVDIKVGPENVTENRPKLDDLSVTTRRKIYDWIYLDIELYEAASHLAGRSD